jgi:hypothetical protein
MSARFTLMVLGFGACLVGPAVAQDDEWITVGRTGKMTWHMKSGSLTFTEMQDSVPVVMVVGRTTEHATGRMTVYKWYIPVRDCERGMGDLFVLSIGGEPKSKHDFVYGSASAASGLAEYICARYDESKPSGERRGQVR